jgi:hypothetical protein
MMKKAACLLVVITVFISCHGKITPDRLPKINGYWEIEKVDMPDGGEKEYTVNPTIDYFEIKADSGFRKKVMPQFDGTYRGNDIKEGIKVVYKDDKTYLDYTTNYAKWKEELITLDDDELVVKNQHGIIYHYKKPQPFTLK